MAINVKDMKPPRRIKPRVPLWYDNPRLMKGAALFIAAFVLVVLGVAAYVLQTQPVSEPPPEEKPPNEEPGPITALATFASCQEIANTLRSFQETREQALAVPGLFERQAFAPEAGGGGGDASAAFDYSRTNVQVEGVDEADIVKTDGKYIYVLTQKNELHVIEAAPPQQAKKLSTMVFQENSHPQEFFVAWPKILVFGQKFTQLDPRPGFPVPQTDDRVLFFPQRSSVTFIEMYSVENPLVPKFERTLEFEGTYLTSRKIGTNVHFVLNSYPDAIMYSQEAGDIVNADAILPRYRDTAKAQGASLLSSVVSCDQVAKLDPFTSAQFLSIVSLRIDDPAIEPSIEVVAGAGDKVYASAQNLYVASPYFEYSRPPRLEVIGFPVFQRQDTIINKFSLEGSSASFTKQGRVPGTVLNQFSMDEDGDFFRIATTVGEAFGETPTKNNVYVLDEGLKITGSVENLAPGETIYSARFIGKRAYLVTFKKIDPFFVIDLTEPQNPKVLGALKIPGFSDYLHPLDENHIIGIGKNTAEDESGEFAWFQGMKLAVFDVTTPQNPKELHKIELGDRGTDSPALQNHKAFFYDSERNVLALPVLLAQLPPELKGQPEPDRFLYGDYVFQGSYVWRVTPEQGFVLLGRVTHIEDRRPLAPYYSVSEQNAFIYRNVQIGEYLYSISDGKVLAHKLDGLALAGEVRLNE